MPVRPPSRAHRGGDGHDAIVLVASLLLIVPLYFVSRANYLLFHSVIELFSVLVYFALASIIIANFQRADGFFRIIGLTFAFIAVIDFTHTLAYRGMGVFPDRDANLPTQLWIAARYIQAIVLVAAPFALQKKIRAWSAIVPALATVGVLLSIFHFEIFPDCFVEGSGLTPFKRISEYVISGMVATGIVILTARRKALGPRWFVRLVVAYSFTVAAEMSFTLYANVYGIANVIGHLFRFVSGVALFMITFDMLIVRSRSLLYRELATKSEALRNLARRLVEARESGKQHTAKELNDDISQHLVAMRMELSRLKRGIDNGEECRREMASMRSILDHVDSRVRSMIQELRPPIIDDLGLVDGTRQLCITRGDASGIPISFAATGFDTESDLPGELRTTIYRAAEEAVTNALAHSRATAVRVRLLREESSIGAEVRDDGVGIEPDAIHRVTSTGLLAMQEHAALWGGTVQVSPGEQSGTVVVLTIPLPARRSSLDSILDTVLPVR